MELFTILAGAIAMILIQILKNKNWSQGAKVVTAVLVSVALAALEAYLQGTPIIIANIAIIFSIATVLYKTYFGSVQWMAVIGDAKIL